MSLLKCSLPTICAHDKYGMIKVVEIKVYFKKILIRLNETSTNAEDFSKTAKQCNIIWQVAADVKTHFKYIILLYIYYK